MMELRIFTTSVLDVVPSVLLVRLLVALCVGLGLLLWQKGVKEGLRQSALLLLAEWLILVIGISVIFRESGATYDISLVPFSSYFDYGENSYFMEKVVLNILNVALFIPIGLLLGLGFRSMTWRRALSIAVMFSVLIEILQLVSRRGLCEVDDVIHNTAGCMIGYVIYWLLSKMIHKCFS